jgi:hypothetical protein
VSYVVFEECGSFFEMSRKGLQKGGIRPLMNIKSAATPIAMRKMSCNAYHIPRPKALFRQSRRKYSLFPRPMTTPEASGRGAG